jgi:hypothetical protein
MDIEGFRSSHYVPSSKFLLPLSFTVPTGCYGTTDMYTQQPQKPPRQQGFIGRSACSNESSTNIKAYQSLASPLSGLTFSRLPESASPQNERSLHKKSSTDPQKGLRTFGSLISSASDIAKDDGLFPPPVASASGDLTDVEGLTMNATLVCCEKADDNRSASL